MPRGWSRGLLAALGAVGLVLAPVAHADPGGYVVEPGDTLSQIAEKTGVGLAALVKLNELEDANFVVVGQSLKLPAGAAGASSPASPVSPASPRGPASAAAAAASGGANRTYAVEEGDTLSGIAKRFGTSTAALVEANTLEDADRLRAGFELKIPSATDTTDAANASPSTRGGAASQASGAEKPEPAAEGGNEGTPAAAAVDKRAALVSGAASAGPKRSLLVSYTVQSGETLNQIARQFDVKSDVIVQASGLEDPNRIRVGAVLKVPLPGREHVVVAGETLRDIAAQEKVDLGSLIDFNALDDPELIRVGQMLLVPAPPAHLQAATTSGTGAAAPRAATVASAAPPSGATGAATQASRAALVTGPAPAAASKPTASAGAAPKPTAAAAAPKPQVPAPRIPPPAGAATDGLVGAGLKLLGAPYVWGGSSPSGFDCSGFVWYVARQVGKPLSRGMLGEYNGGSHPSREELKAGDLVFFQNTYSPGLSHNGIYIGNGQFVHAADESAGVTISNLNAAYWSSHWFGATRLP